MLAYDVIKRPIITERSMDLAGEKKYSFIVDKNANKIQIKEAIEEIFSVKVVSVNTVNYDGKTKRVGRNIGKTAAYKKAIVKLSDDSKELEFFGV